MKLYNFSKIIFYSILVLIGSILLLLGWTKAMGKWGSGIPPAQYPADMQSDLIVVHKTERQLVLMRHGTIIARYPISMGMGADRGAKRREGDKKTPEGYYIIDSRNPHSRFYLSLHISYPDQNDLQWSQARGYLAGENIMIHGLPNGWGWFEYLFRHFDWTDGCIAVNNEDMREIWARVPDETPIEIEP